MLEGYDIGKLEDKIFEEVEDDIISNTSPRITEKRKTTTEK
jgi:hypothetical protein